MNKPNATQIKIIISLYRKLLDEQICSCTIEKGKIDLCQSCREVNLLEYIMDGFGITYVDKEF